jgi:hypothetical protein
MRRLILFLLPVIIFALFTPAFPLADVANDTVLVIEDKDHVVFYGIIQYTLTDSTNNITTQAMSGEALEWENAQLRCYTNTQSGDDVNVFMMGGGSRDLTYISSVYTQTAFDDVNGGTPAVWWALKDTLMAGASQGIMSWFIDPVSKDRFKVLKFDGQTGNPSATTVTWFLVVPKKATAPSRNAYGIFDTT